MQQTPWIVFSLIVATPTGAQQANVPVAPAAVTAATVSAMPPAPAEATGINQAAAGAVTTQTLSMLQAQQTYVETKAAIERTNAENQRQWLAQVAATEAANAATRAAYQKEWIAYKSGQHTAGGSNLGSSLGSRTRDVASLPGDVTVKGLTRRICKMEGVTGSLIAPKRVCRSVADARDRQTRTDQEVDAIHAASGRGFTYSPGAPQ